MIYGCINVAMVRDLQREDNLRKLAVFMKMKSIYSNGCFFNATYASLSEKSDISITVLKKCIKFFIERGWCRKHGNNLVFNKIKDIDVMDREKNIFDVQYIKIKKDDTYRDVFKKLKLLLVKAIHDAFEIKKKQSKDYLITDDSVKLSAHKSAVRAYRDGRLTKLISETEKFKISNRKVGSLIKRSKSTGSRLLSYGQKVGMLKREVDVVATNIPASAVTFVEMGMGYFVSKSGTVMKQSCNVVTFL